MLSFRDLTFCPRTTALSWRISPRVCPFYNLKRTSSLLSKVSWSQYWNSSIFKHQTSSRSSESAVLYKATAWLHLYRVSLGLRPAANQSRGLFQSPPFFKIELHWILVNETTIWLEPHLISPQSETTRVKGMEPTMAHLLCCFSFKTPVPLCLLPNTWKQLSPIVCLVLYCLEWRGKPNICYSIIAKV